MVSCPSTTRTEYDAFSRYAQPNLHLPRLCVGRGNGGGLMSHKDKHSSHKAAKKAAILARNKKHTLINEQAALHEDSQRSEREREAELHEAVAAPAVGADGEVVWSARLQKVRNRLTGKKRMAADRWNRFAGTEGGGGRGR